MTEFFVTERQAGYQQTQKGKTVYGTSSPSEQGYKK